MAQNLNEIKVLCYDFTINTPGKNMEKTLIKKVSLILALIIIVVGLLVYFLSSFQNKVVPADFTAARQKAAVVSQDIVNLTVETGKKIALANQAETDGDFNQLLNLIDDAKNSNTSAYQKALDLSRNIQQMAESLNNVSSQQQQLGYEAIALELSLVSEFISYTDNLNGFLNVLTRSVLNGGSRNQKEVSDALRAVNQKAELINIINKNFINKMTAFDLASGTS
ncbi:hypothetical protein D4R51_04165 [bacterium]|nr:MAG: hypothetical protein D4R51_04165 [bacterium]